MNPLTQRAGGLGGGRGALDTGRIRDQIVDQVAHGLGQRRTVYRVGVC